MNAVAAAPISHDLLAHSHRGRDRSASEVYAPPVQREMQDPAELPRAASYTYFPRVKDLLEEPSILELKGTISVEQLKSVKSNGEGASYPSSGDSSPSSEEAPQPEEPLQMKPVLSRRSSRFLPFSSKSRDSSEEPKPDRDRRGALKGTNSPTSMSPVRSLTQLRRKSWISSQSRSSSPAKEKDGPAKGEKPGKTSMQMDRRKSLTGKMSIPEEPGAGDAETTPATTPKARVLSKKTKRPLSGIFSATPTPQQVTPAATNHIPAVPPLPKSFSTEKLPLNTHNPTSPTHTPPLPRNISHEKFKGVKTEPRKKDELWTVFRTLEGDHRKFQAKSMALKANVVRTTLLPFLRQYASHPSTHKLRPEDLDRRANILNGWWTALLELLAGRNNQSISGTDRPAILEGIAGIMERPEWRMAPSPFCALADRSDTSSTNTAQSSLSHSSSSSDFLAESVYHNVRNIFTQNLLSQIAFVVDKMSLRNAAASLVTFCGKTCAYAFCFCPGVADVLVRIWNPSTELMRRVLDESGVSRLDRLDVLSERIIPPFPPMLHPLKFHSLARAVRYLRNPAPAPLGTSNLDWHGSWVKRWQGAESDLFYVFVKHYHMLVTDFLPVEPTPAERMCVPGLVMVHAQILANLDATVNRHAAPPQQEEPASGPAPITFDDVLSDTDTSAAALPIPPANATRQMAENRLIMLIRDFLSERNAHLLTARRIFADSFSRLLKGAARKVSIYDNNACYTLCDFLEEAFVILVRYEQLDMEQHSVLDWPFWLSVCKSMTASHNTATEIKLFAFLYSTWPILVSDDTRKATLCLDFLLEPEFFQSRFNHWCPMVRSYYMRLLCWRLARFDGDETVGEFNILKSLSNNLRSVWSHYLWLREEAEFNETLPPCTAPCNPAPGRRFLILRNDNPIVSNSGPFISFDGVVQSPSSKRLSTINTTIPDLDARPVSAQSGDSQDFGEEETSKGRWNILRSFMSVTKQSPKTASKDKKSTTPAEATSKGKSVSPNRESPTPSPPSHRSFSFRFSLEWVDKRFHNNQNMRFGPPRLPSPAQMLLQTKGISLLGVPSCKPAGSAAMSSRYAGRALAEWTLICHECQNFSDRRKNEGVPSNRLVETPTLAVEAFRRPG
ncbi:hypothetical protein BCR34DRAFT_602117 [Clohesyomyces aquaticus]|uniref:DUF1765-domain-containing protein n=1 Tax=Clohesyomyces aquaticus TaxID=1231657 RepID=A0A1Y1ZJF3_9PLEO|nr:hypothetical protein BCR34DRAFT_602117 [Clohesyomyces aquaticus]